MSARFEVGDEVVVNTHLGSMFHGMRAVIVHVQARRRGGRAFGAPDRYDYYQLNVGIPAPAWFSEDELLPSRERQEAGEA